MRARTPAAIENARKDGTTLFGLGSLLGLLQAYRVQAFDYADIQDVICTVESTSMHPMSEHAVLAQKTWTDPAQVQAVHPLHPSSSLDNTQSHLTRDSFYYSLPGTCHMVLRQAPRDPSNKSVRERSDQYLPANDRRPSEIVSKRSEVYGAKDGDPSTGCSTHSTCPVYHGGTEMTERIWPT